MQHELTRIEMLGGLHMKRAGRIVTRFATHKTAALLARLAFHAGKIHAREELAGQLWPDADEAAGRQSLRQALSSLRRLLEPPGVPAGSVLVADRLNVRLESAAVTTDVAEFEAAVRAGRLADAIGLYGGDLLPGIYDDWVLRERDRLADACRGALAAFSDSQAADSHWESALDSAHRALALAPADEDSHLRLMRLYRQAGRPDDARRQFARLADVLRDEVGETPSEEARAILDDLPPLPAHPPPRPPTPSPSRGRGGEDLLFPSPLPREGEGGAQAPGEGAKREGAAEKGARLPIALSRFFGREDEIARLLPWLCDPETRLVTLTGTGGVGKTRLSLELLRRLAPTFTQAVAFVPLADLRVPELILPAVADALRLAPGNGDPRASIAAAFAVRPFLLVLDNMEQLAETGGADVVETLLRDSPTLTILATSRQRLGVDGEREFALSPLPVPLLPAPLEALDSIPSVRLFVARAQEVRPDFGLTARNAPAVAALCDRLEGLPLALELAAAWSGALTPAQMLVRLEHRFELLVSRRKGIGARHRTLRAAIEWSWHLLPADLQRLFAALSVFRGGWTLEAAEWVCPMPNVLDSLARLRERSLVVTEEVGDALRWRLLESLREWGEEQLDGNERNVLARRHAEWCARLAGEADTRLSGPEQAQWWERLAREHDNLRAALAWAAEADGHLALRLAAVLARFWSLRGHLREDRARLDDILARTADDTSAARARALYAAALYALHQGDDRQAEAWFSQSLALWQALGQTEQAASALNGLGMVASGRGDFEAARRLYKRSLTRYREAGASSGVATTIGNLGDIAHNVDGDFDLAHRCYTESIRLLQTLGNTGGVAHFQRALGEVSACRGEGADADRHFNDSLSILRGLGDKIGIARTLSSWADARAAAGAAEDASRLYRDALRLRAELEQWRDAEDLLRRCARLREDENHPGPASRLTQAADRLHACCSAAPMLSYDAERCARIIAEAEEEPLPLPFSRGGGVGKKEYGPSF